MRYVIALGGNALLQRHEMPDAGVQRHHVAIAAAALAPLAAQHEVIICHGNGPQIGVLANESDADPTLSAPFPLDVLGAQTQGMIGYWISQELRNAGLTTPVACIVSQTRVAADDPAMAQPAKFIGPLYTERRARRLATEHGWTVRQDTGGWRRVVPSPDPVAVEEIATIRTLLAAGTTVVCGGGGGAPVTADPGSGRLSGVEAVVDKDLVAALLAEAVDADRLALLTDVSALMRDFGTPSASPIDVVHVESLPTGLAPGSMGPKVEACRRFTSRTGRPSSIGALGEAAQVVAGTAGTTVLP